MSGELPRHELVLQMPVRSVWLMDGSSMGCDHPDLLSAILQSFLGSWNGASTTGRRNGCFGFTASRLRWRELYAALWFNWRSPASFWGLGEGLWILRRAGGGLEKKMAAGLILDRKRG